MILRVTRLGRIDGAEIDVRPLTVFIGPNGTNKTWTAYALHAVMRLLAQNSGNSWGVLRTSPELRARASSAASELIGKVAAAASDNGDIDVTVEREAVFGLYGGPQLELPLAELERAIGVPFALSANGSTKSAARVPVISLELSDGDLRQRVFDSLRMTFHPSGSAMSSSTFLRSDGSSVARNYGYFGDPPPLRGSLEPLLEWLSLPHPLNAIVLPTERTFLTQQYHRADAARSTTVLSDFTDFLRLASGLFRGTSFIHSAPNHELLARLQTNILGGFVQLSEVGAVEFVPYGTSSPVLPVQAAASLVKSMAPLSLYLQHHATPGDVLVIDEPELNAHPEAILAVTEILAALANYGVHVILTTHSPYVVDHLTNLIEGERLSGARRGEMAARLKTKSEQTFISEDKVAVYLFEPEGEKVIVRSVLDRGERDIDWTTFARVSDETTNLYGDILDAEAPRE